MLKLLSLFSGIGAFEKALENIGEPFDVIRYCEIDKYASKAYSLIHNLDENMNLKDVCSVKTEELPDDIDLITYGFPCQDISLSGKQKGFTNEDGSLTRSGLFFEALRIIEETKPKIAIAENVKALTSKKFTATFKLVLDCLNDAGYKNYWAVLNAKDYGIPQNRERVFIISIRNDIDHGFHFPEKYELKLRLKDLLEDTVDEKYFLSDKMLDYITSTGTKNFHYKPEIDLEVARPLTSTMHKSHRASSDNYVSESFVKDDVKLNIDETEKQMTIDEFLPVKEATKKGYKEAHDGDYVNLQYPDSDTRRGRVGEQVANTLLCNDAQGVVIKEPNKNIKPELVGGIGEKKSNGGAQYYQQDRVYSSDTIAMAHPAQLPGGSYKYTVNNDPVIQRIDIPQTVNVRKYEVDKEKLVKTLRHQKKKCGWTNKDLAEELELPVTTVEHWFRIDKHFGIPDPEIWSDLKWLLEMDDIDEFDEAIMTFEDREGVYEKAERCYHENGIAPTITVAMANEKIITDDGCMQIGSLDRKGYHEFSNRIYSPDGCARTLMGEGGNQNDKTGQYLMPNLRIRKLTPKECFRLMGFDDKDCDILVANKISNTQLYKMAGNSIVVDVLEEIFVELLNQYEDVFPCGESL